MTALVRRPGSAERTAERERADATTVGVVEPAADRATFLRAVGSALSFPGHYGENLDALEDCLHDLEWLPEGPVLLVWDDAELHRGAPEVHATLLDILEGAVRDSADGPRPLRVVLADADAE